MPASLKPYRVIPLRPKRPGVPQNKQAHYRRIAVSQWWQGVVARDTLFLGYVPPVHERADEGAWPEWAVLQALHAEYASGDTLRMSRLQFAHWLRECTPCAPIAAQTHVVKDEKGRVKWYGSNTRYSIGKYHG